MEGKEVQKKKEESTAGSKNSDWCLLVQYYLCCDTKEGKEKRMGCDNCIIMTVWDWRQFLVDFGHVICVKWLKSTISEKVFVVVKQGNFKFIEIIQNKFKIFNIAPSAKFQHSGNWYFLSSLWQKWTGSNLLKVI